MHACTTCSPHLDDAVVTCTCRTKEPRTGEVVYGDRTFDLSTCPLFSPRLFLCRVEWLTSRVPHRLVLVFRGRRSVLLRPPRHEAGGQAGRLRHLGGADDVARNADGSLRWQDRVMGRCSRLIDSLDRQAVGT